MNKQPAYAQGGFTLIEILVVVAIVAVLAMALTLSVTGTAARRLENTARRARALIALACERATLTGRDMGIALTTDGLRFGYLIDERWQLLGDDPADPLRPRALGEALRWELVRDGQILTPATEFPPAPQLVCFGSGELTPFVLTLSRTGTESPWQLQGALDGGLTLKAPDRAH